MNPPSDMIRHLPSHLPNNMLGSQHFLPQGQQPQPSSSQPHQMNVLPNGQNPNPSMGMGNPQPQNMGPNPTPAQIYQHHHLNQQRRTQALISATQTTQGMNPNPSAPPHINGVGHNQGLFQNSMIQSQNRRAVPQPGINQPGVNHIPGMHTGQQNMQNMGGIGINAHQNLRMPPQQMNVRMPQQQPQPPQMPGQMSPEMSMSLNPRQSHMQGNPGMPSAVPRGQPSQPPIMGNIPQPQSLPQSHPTGMQPPMHYQSPMPMAHQQPQPQIGQSPHSGSHTQSQPSGNMPMQQPMAEPAPNRRMTPENSIYMPFQNQQFNQNLSHNGRMSNNNSFGFPSASNPPDQDMGSGLSNPSVPPGRTSFHYTPAQQLHMQRSSENFNASHFHMPPHQSHPPPRPPSLNPQSQSISLQPTQPSQQSPDHMAMNGPMQNLQRPQSQPQMQPGPVRPPSQQAGLPRTPHVSQPTLPGMQQPPRMPSTIPTSAGGGQTGSSLGPQPGPSQPAQMPAQQQIQSNVAGPSGQQGHSFPIGSQRQPNQGISAAAPGPAIPSSGNAEGSSAQVSNPSQHKVIIPPIGMGQGIQRLLQFSAILADEKKSKLQLSYWDSLVKEYFTPKAVMKYTLWKDNQRNEAKPFEIGVPILPRFFLVTSQSGVKAMNISLDGARERIISPGHAVVECVSAVWTYKYTNGYTIHLRGPLTAHIWVVQSSQQVAQTSSTPGGPMLVLKFEHLQFDANYHDKYITIDAIAGQKIGKSPHVRNAPTPMMNGIGSQQQQQPDGKDDRIHYERSSIPAEPVNAFGVPQATMRCLELAESVAQMTDLIQFSTENHLGPLQSLKQFAKKIRESQGPNALRMMVGNNPMGGPGFQKDGPFGGKTMPSNSSITLYHGAPASSMPISTHHSMAPNTPQNPPPSGDVSSPSKQNKVPPSQQQQSTASAASSSTPTSTPASTAQSTTPSMAAATLDRKRKANTDTSPPTEYSTNSKRHGRKRRTTGSG